MYLFRTCDLQFAQQRIPFGQSSRSWDLRHFGAKARKSTLARGKKTRKMYLETVTTASFPNIFVQCNSRAQQPAVDTMFEDPREKSFLESMSISFANRMPLMMRQPNYSLQCPVAVWSNALRTIKLKFKSDTT